MKRLNVIWFLTLLALSTDVLAKRRSGSSVSLFDNDFFVVMLLVVVGSAVLVFMIEHRGVGDVINAAVLMWMFAKFNIDAAWCGYAETMTPDRLTELCIFDDGEPYTAGWRIFLYVAVVLVDGGLLTAAVCLVRNKWLERNRRIRDKTLGND